MKVANFLEYNGHKFTGVLIMDNGEFRVAGETISMKLWVEMLLYSLLLESAQQTTGEAFTLQMLRVQAFVSASIKPCMKPLGLTTKDGVDVALNLILSPLRAVLRIV